jgi:tetratricopeptide (TPR) repeat protein
LDSRFKMREKEEDKENGSLVYKSGNDTIIQPPEYKEKSITNTLVNLLLGLLVGAAALWFLIVPAKTQKINQEANKKVVEYSGKMATLSAELARMQEEMDASTESVNTAQTQIQEAGEKAGAYENLIKAWQAHQEGNSDTAANAIEGVNAELLSVEAKSMYDSIMKSVGSTVRKKYVNEASAAMESGDYDTAIVSLEKALNIGKQDRNIMFQLAQAYDKKGDKENANQWYQKIIDEFPGTKVASDAKDYLEANGGLTQAPSEGDAETPSDDEGQSDGGETSEGGIQTGETIEE